jgi:NAD(P) transhydrogenase subunit alpha
MYAKNVATFLQNLLKNGNIHLDLEDQIVRETLLTHEGEVVNAQVRELLGLPALTQKNDEKESSS